MKTAVMILPKRVSAIEDEGYLLSCMNKITMMGYTPLHFVEQYREIDLPEFVSRVGICTDAYFLFVDYGISELMIDIIKQNYIGGLFKKEIHIEINCKDTCLSLTGILYFISEKQKVTIGQMQGRCRNREFVAARQYYCKYARENTKYSLARIGLMISRDHATVMHGIKTVNETRELITEYCDLFKLPYPEWVNAKKKIKPEIKIDSVKAEIMAMMPHAPESERKVIRGDVHQTHFKGYMEHCMKA